MDPLFRSPVNGALFSQPTETDSQVGAGLFGVLLNQGMECLLPKEAQTLREVCVGSRDLHTAYSHFQKNQYILVVETALSLLSKYDEYTQRFLEQYELFKESHQKVQTSSLEEMAAALKQVQEILANLKELSSVLNLTLPSLETIETHYNNIGNSLSNIGLRETILRRRIFLIRENFPDIINKLANEVERVKKNSEKNLWKHVISELEKFAKNDQTPHFPLKEQKAFEKLMKRTSIILQDQYWLIFAFIHKLAIEGKISTLTLLRWKAFCKAIGIDYELMSATKLQQWDWANHTQRLLETLPHGAERIKGESLELIERFADGATKRQFAPIAATLNVSKTNLALCFKLYDIAAFRGQRDVQWEEWKTTFLGEFQGMEVGLQLLIFYFSNFWKIYSKKTRINLFTTHVNFIIELFPAVPFSKFLEVFHFIPRQYRDEVLVAVLINYYQDEILDDRIRDYLQLFVDRSHYFSLLKSLRQNNIFSEKLTIASINQLLECEVRDVNLNQQIHYELKYITDWATRFRVIQWISSFEIRQELLFELFVEIVQTNPDENNELLIKVEVALKSIRRFDFTPYLGALLQRRHIDFFLSVVRPHRRESYLACFLHMSPREALAMTNRFKKDCQISVRNRFPQIFRLPPNPELISPKDPQVQRAFAQFMLLNGCKIPVKKFGSFTRFILVETLKLWIRRQNLSLYNPEIERYNQHALNLSGRNRFEAFYYICVYLLNFIDDRKDTIVKIVKSVPENVNGKLLRSQFILKVIDAIFLRSDAGKYKNFIYYLESLSYIKLNEQIIKKKCQKMIHIGHLIDAYEIARRGFSFHSDQMHEVCVEIFLRDKTLDQIPWNNIFSAFESFPEEKKALIITSWELAVQQKLSSMNLAHILAFLSEMPQNRLVKALMVSLFKHTLHLQNSFPTNFSFFEKNRWFRDELDEPTMRKFQMTARRRQDYEATNQIGRRIGVRFGQ